MEDEIVEMGEGIEIEMWENGGARSEDLQQSSGGGEILQSSFDSLRSSIGSVTSGTDNLMDVTVVTSGAEEMWTKMQGLIKVLLGFMQIVGTLTVNLPSVDWPASLVSVWDAVGSVANLDLISGLSLSCVSESWSFYSTFAVTVSLPLAALGVAVLVTAIRVQNAADEEEVEHMKEKAWQFGLVGSFIVYPSVSATILKAWHCRDIEGTWWLVADYHLKCHGSEYDMCSSVAAGAFLIYPVGIPSLYLYELFTKFRYLYEQDWEVLAAQDREAASDEGKALLLSAGEMEVRHKQVLAKYGFLYVDYERGAYYWEVIMLLQKLMLTGLLIFIKPGTVSQLAVGFAISFGFFILHVRS